MLVDKIHISGNLVGSWIHETTNQRASGTRINYTGLNELMKGNYGLRLA